MAGLVGRNYDNDNFIERFYYYGFARSRYPAVKRGHADWLLERLAEANIQHRLVHGRKHPRVYFTVNGREAFQVIAASPSDRRGLRNSLSDIKRKVRELERA